MAEGGSSPTGGLGDLFSRLQEARADLEAQEEAIEAGRARMRSSARQVSSDGGVLERAPASSRATQPAAPLSYG